MYVNYNRLTPNSLANTAKAKKQAIEIKAHKPSVTQKLNFA